MAINNEKFTREGLKNMSLFEIAMLKTEIEDSIVAKAKAMAAAYDADDINLFLEHASLRGVGYAQLDLIDLEVERRDEAGPVSEEEYAAVIEELLNHMLGGN